MAAFAASSQMPELAAESPHHNSPPPHLQHQAFSHQLSTAGPPFSGLSSPPRPQITPRSSTDFRHASANGTMSGANGNGPMPVPAGSHGRAGNGHAANLRGMGFDGPRSPPNNKSMRRASDPGIRLLTARKGTSHVPCKFYRQGACQAGKACPFLHSDEPLTERAPCKYFTKGNCKFGPKCALAHILPNGHVVNRGSFVGGGYSLGGRVNLPHSQNPPSGSSLLTMQAHAQPTSGFGGYPGQDEYFGQKMQYENIPTIDTTFSSHPGSNYGSPPTEGGRRPLSPVPKGLTVMDVQLPASFDSNGISHVARYGPIASSMPAGFGANSPPSSYQNDSPALRNLRDSAFGDDSRSRAAALGSSPPDSIEQPLGRRIMHSEMRRPKGMISASVGARPPMAAQDDWDDSDLVGGRFEEDLIPSSLNDLLTPQEKMRRFSRDHGDNEGNSLSHRHSLSRLGASPTASDMKVGSPTGAASSPSRFQSLWGKKADTGGEPGSLPGISPFGHVGSPLRNSSLHPGASPSLRAMNRPTSGEASPFVSSPPRQASMSMISQQLQRTRLSSRASDGAEAPILGGNPMHPGYNRVTSSGSIGSSSSRLGMDRAVSSTSIGRERIEEEQGLFSMEEEEELERLRSKEKDGASTTSSTSNKRLSGLSWGSGGKASPSIAPIGGHRVAGSQPTLGKEPGPWGNPS
ncbi:hypothetical protein EJ04DRAFT_523400 [Polyplosphaeria fusca]|uniref:C3H1-type domain-containing protein n=1 Tax=Polyplosphaeria fusca TaxID=682080 RepID=A0A9P4UZW9_9PLEO|nr:hypothetical protein EJ04DRAFT_523400 [Polyplosphaeria fusca]